MKKIISIFIHAVEIISILVLFIKCIRLKEDITENTVNITDNLNKIKALSFKINLHDKKFESVGSKIKGIEDDLDNIGSKVRKITKNIRDENI